MPALKKYSKKDFNKDLTKLKKLIGSYKGGSHSAHGELDGYSRASPGAPIQQAPITGGRKAKRPVKRPVKRSVKKSNTKKAVRSFTIVTVDGKKIPGGEGRYTNATAANKACSRALSKRNKNKLVLDIRETTAGSDKKVKCYDCSRTKLKTPLVIKRAGGVSYTVNYKTHIKERVK